MEEHNPGKAGIPIAVGIIVGLLASFVQSLGKYKTANLIVTQR
jgi:hypothetical protein